MSLIEQNQQLESNGLNSNQHDQQLDSDGLNSNQHDHQLDSDGVTSNQHDLQLEPTGMIQSLCYYMIKSFFDQVDVKINGNRKGDIQIKNEKVYYRMIKFMFGIDRLAMGESYVDEDWDTDDVDEFLLKCLNNQITYGKSLRYVFKFMKFPFYYLNLQSKDRSKKNISSHYDIGNDLFKLMLDKSMNYSCGYWQKNVFLRSSDSNNNPDFKMATNTICDTLDEAQLNKMLLIGKKLHLKPGMKVLDIGCGWGYLAKFLAINFDVHVVGITISEEQLKYATSTDLKPNELEFLRINELESNQMGKFEFRLIDYRDVEEKFDRIVSVGMFEHVGSKNYDEFFTIVKNCLDENGLFLLHTIGVGFPQIPNADPWTVKYIFPGGSAPYHNQIVDATSGKFLIEDWHNMGMDYYRTLCAWKDNFIKSWPQLKDKYDERFKRIWMYYLSGSSTVFYTRRLQLYQIVFSNRGFPGGYVSFR